MNRLTRISAILIQLQSKKIVTAKEIAMRFDISLRTVYRDIKTLQEAGVPISSENGVGYFIVEGYNLPPISITEEEANALIISEQFIQQQGDTSLSKNLESLFFKIKSILRSFEKDKVEFLENRIYSFTNSKKYESHWLSEIQKSIANQQVLKIDYYSIYKEEVTIREIEPLAVYFTNNAWILIAYCHLRLGLREFRLDRIQKLFQLDKSSQNHLDFSLKKYFESFED